METSVLTAAITLLDLVGAKLWALFDDGWKCVAGNCGLLRASVLVTFAVGLGGMQMCNAAENGRPEEPSRSVLIDIGKLHLKVPIAYLPHRWKYVSSTTRTAMPSISFAFVMPDGKPASHVDPAWIVAGQYKLPESERAPGKFLVDIRNFTVIADDSYVSPAQGFRNRLALGTQLLEPEFGLDKFSQRPVAKAIYGKAQQAEPEVMFDCMDQEAADRISPGLQPLCNGVAFYPSNRFEFRLGLPAEHFSQWSNIVSAAHRLLSSWIERND